MGRAASGTHHAHGQTNGGRRRAATPRAADGRRTRGHGAARAAGGQRRSRTAHDWSHAQRRLFERAQALFVFRQRYPGVVLDLQEMNSSEMPEALHQRRLDLALLRPPFCGCGPVAPCPCTPEPHGCWALRRGHPLAAKRWVTMEQ
ncbi:hypothetical protein CTI14_31395, partial [Methylobacterium radiotolerans]